MSRFFLNKGNYKKKNDQCFQEKFLQAAQEKELGISVLMLFIRALILGLVKRVGMGHNGTIGKLVNVKKYSLIGYQ